MKRLFSKGGGKDKGPTSLDTGKKEEENEFSWKPVSRRNKGSKLNATAFPSLGALPEELIIEIFQKLTPHELCLGGFLFVSLK